MNLINTNITLSVLIFLYLNITNVYSNLQNDMNVEESVYTFVKYPRLNYFNPPLICEGKQAEKLAMTFPKWNSRKIRQVGKLKSMFGHNQCLSYLSNQSKDAIQRVVMKYCTKFHDYQIWTHTIKGKIRQKDLCLEYSRSQRTAYVDLCKRNDENQHWFYNPRTSLLHHIGTDKCLGLKRLNSRYKLTLMDCCKNLLSPLAQWHMFNV